MECVKPIIASLILVCGIGCHHLSSTPDKEILTDFEKVDRLSIGSASSDRHITDSETIERLCDIYRRADWEPFWDTVPADIVGIHAYQGEEELFRLSFGASWLIERSPEGELIRKAVLNEDDRSWLRSLVDVNGRRH